MKEIPTVSRKERERGTHSIWVRKLWLQLAQATKQQKVQRQDGLNSIIGMPGAFSLSPLLSSGPHLQACPPHHHKMASSGNQGCIVPSYNPLPGNSNLFFKSNGIYLYHMPSLTNNSHLGKPNHSWTRPGRIQSPGVGSAGSEGHGYVRRGGHLNPVGILSGKMEGECVVS